MELAGYCEVCQCPVGHSDSLRACNTRVKAKGESQRASLAAY